MDSSPEDARVRRTRADVSRVGLDVLVGEGFDALTHSHLANLAGYSKTTLYTHWPAKLDLLKVALGSVGRLWQVTPSGDLQLDLQAEMTGFRDAIDRIGLDKILMVLAQHGQSDVEIAELRQEIVQQAESGIINLLLQQGIESGHDIAVNLALGSVLMPCVMHDSPPDDTQIATTAALIATALQH